MNTKSNMIIANGKIVTADVSYCTLNTNTNMWDLTFNNGRCYHYRRQNLVWLKNPISLNPADIQIRVNGEILTHIVEILKFKNNINTYHTNKSYPVADNFHRNIAEIEYWHIRFYNGFERSYAKSEIEINYSCLADAGANKVFNYLKKVASLISVRTEDDTAILIKQYEKLDFLDDRTAAAVYLNPAKYVKSTDDFESTPIFPFGCNKSQFRAVSIALSERFSVIEGPPGTGKTQTILNIIANLVMNGKTIQVVSNNNSAIENIIDKLNSPKYQLGFFVASLGKTEKKQAFINSQTGVLPNFTSSAYLHNDPKEFYNRVQQRSVKLSDIFKRQNHMATLRQELDNITLEEYHSQIKNDQQSSFLSLKRRLSSSDLMHLLIEYQHIKQSDKTPSILGRILFWIRYGLKVKMVLGESPICVETEIQRMFYETRKQEIELEISDLEPELAKINAEEFINDFTENSLACFRSRLAKKYKKERPVFQNDDLWMKPDAFLKEYPVVLSTTYTAKSSLGKNAIFDYVIIDEASQVDVATGFLALSSAKNAVIVGDMKQLPNVITSDQKLKLQEIFDAAGISQAYNFTENSFLGSVLALLGDSLPRTVLQEHYRCNPKIIGFCNSKFYNNDLIVLTKEGDNALRLYETVPGKHSREHGNLRQAEVVRDEILPDIDYPNQEIGIIVPYVHQVQLVKRILNKPDIEVATIHKFQGREKNVIIFLTTDDIVTEFSDDANLLNVAVSRAKKLFILVTSGNSQPSGSNTADLIGYIRYNNGIVFHSTINSVFDYLYEQYGELRQKFLSKHKRISKHPSENLMYGLIIDILKERTEPLGVLTHQPLYQLIRDDSLLNNEEKRFVRTGLSHLDLLIYNKVSKIPLLAIEVDGYNNHKEGTVQAERDKLKNHIMEVYNIPLLRFVTNGSGERKAIIEKLDQILHA